MGSSSQRPRQRTSTSCTECRRRKQKCNQAKDRPCNNCARRYPPVACLYDGENSRDSTVERVIELHEEGTAIEDIPSGYESLSQRNHSSYIPVSDVQYANSSSTYYAPAQTATTSYWPEQDPTWNTQYTTPSSSSYDASYYNNSMTQTRGESYDAGYYSTEYSATYPQQGSWYATASSDARSFVQNDTTYENFDDPTISSSRQNSDGVHYSYPGASSS